MYFVSIKMLFLADNIGDDSGNQHLQHISKFRNGTLHLHYDRLFDGSKIITKSLRSILLEIFSKSIIFEMLTIFSCL